MAVIVRTASQMIALPMVWLVGALRSVSPTIWNMFSLTALSPWPSSASSRSSLICSSQQLLKERGWWLKLA